MACDHARKLWAGPLEDWELATTSYDSMLAQYGSEQLQAIDKCVWQGGAAACPLAHMPISRSTNLPPQVAPHGAAAGGGGSYATTHHADRAREAGRHLNYAETRKAPGPRHHAPLQ
jgi:hypothetical protein